LKKKDGLREEEVPTSPYKASKKILEGKILFWGEKRREYVSLLGGGLGKKKWSRAAEKIYYFRGGKRISSNFSTAGKKGRRFRPKGEVPPSYPKGGKKKKEKTCKSEGVGKKGGQNALGNSTLSTCYHSWWEKRKKSEAKKKRWVGLPHSFRKKGVAFLPEKKCCGGGGEKRRFGKVQKAPASRKKKKGDSFLLWLGGLKKKKGKEKGAGKGSKMEKGKKQEFFK